MSAIATEGQLYELLSRAGPRNTLPAGTVIFTAGDTALSMFILVSGTVTLYRRDEALHTIQPPGMFGEMALIDASPRSLTVVADTEVEIVEIPERRFWVLVHETPRFAQLVMRVMADRVRHLSDTA